MLRFSNISIVENAQRTIKLTQTESSTMIAVYCSCFDKL
jgi:hypothetical protein